jgi:hypothetical protein
MTKGIAERKACGPSRELVHEFEQAMASVTGEFAEREVYALALANELTRGWMERELQQIADTFDATVVVSKQRYRRHAVGTVTYHSLCGPLKVRRHSYRVVGIHNGPTVIPLELAAGIHARATRALAHSVVHGFAIGPLRDYEDAMRIGHRSVPSRSTLERMAKAVATQLDRDAPTLERDVRGREVVAANAHSITVGIDRTTAPMAEPTGLVCARDAPPYMRQPPPQIVVNYRMPYVATVAVNDAAGNVITSKRNAATIEAGPAELLAWLAAEVKHVLAQRPRLPVVVIQDGAPELWNLIDAWESDFAIPITFKLIDRYHVNARLSAVAENIEPDPRRRWKLLERWKASLARSDLAIPRLVRNFYALVNDVYDDETNWPYCEPRSRATLHGLRARVVEGHQNYFARYAHHMKYATARRRHFPIASGVTEGACKSLIGARCKRSGQRWQDHGLTRCLLTRSLHLNGRLGGCIDRFLVEARASLGSA